METEWGQEPDSSAVLENDIQIFFYKSEDPVEQIEARMLDTRYTPEEHEEFVEAVCDRGDLDRDVEEKMKMTVEKANGLRKTSKELDSETPEKTYKSAWQRKLDGESSFGEDKELPDLDYGVPDDKIPESEKSDPRDCNGIEAFQWRIEFRDSDIKLLLEDDRDSTNMQDVFRLVLRLLVVYGWDETYSWLMAHWTTEKEDTIGLMAEAGSSYDDIEVPEEAKSFL